MKLLMVSKRKLKEDQILQIQLEVKATETHETRVKKISFTVTCY